MNTRLVVFAVITIGAPLAALAADDDIATMDLGYTTPSIERDVAESLDNPVESNDTSVQRGRELYGSTGCVDCHGSDGRALIEVSGDATDLTTPSEYESGTSDGEIFRSIRDGAGVAMPPHKGQIRDSEEIWHIVNYIKTLWE